MWEKITRILFLSYITIWIELNLILPCDFHLLSLSLTFSYLFSMSLTSVRIFAEWIKNNNSEKIQFLSTQKGYTQKGYTYNAHIHIYL